MSREVVPGSKAMRVPIAGRHLGLPGSPETLLEQPAGDAIPRGVTWLSSSSSKRFLPRR